MILSCIYIFIFCALIYFLPFFRDNSIKRRVFISVFLLKIIAGFFLTLFYTNYYPDRQTADIYKYFDDSKIIFSSVQNHHYTDYFKIMSGIRNDNVYFNE